MVHSRTTAHIGNDGIVENKRVGWSTELHHFVTYLRNKAN